MYSILCLEDSAEVQIVIKATLGFIHRLVFASSISEARMVLGKEKLDAVILDIGLPDGDGLRFCSELKTNPLLSMIPIFVLTGNNSINEKTLGFQLGIEDFISKPFDPLELRLRIETRLKKMEDQKNHLDSLMIGLVKINFSAQRATIDTTTGILPLEFSATEFKILSFLAKNLDQVKSREQIIEAAWSDGLNISDRTVDSHISRIRKKLRDGNCFILPVSGLGYRLTVNLKKQVA